jgi:hypothetical protein
MIGPNEAMKKWSRPIIKDQAIRDFSVYSLPAQFKIPKTGVFVNTIRNQYLASRSGLVL